ncbi:MAG TPA: ABC transporter ATP-binding protein [Vicinamibacterales bacterium]|nr:ABC transporter ATP-binding protein [Vicinamibacterales bacterium]
MMLLQTTGLSKAFGGLRAVDGVDLSVDAGAIYGIIGPNGAGKTTFFNLISRALPATSGSIAFDGHDITPLQAHQVARRGLARTFQATTLFPDATALENVLVGYRQRMSSGLFDAMVRTARLSREERDAEAAAAAALAAADLAHVASRGAKSLTQEQQKRLAIAVALVAKPKLLLLDEPFAGINANQTRGLIAFIESIAATGVTILLIEHQMQVVMQLCRRIMVLDYGKKIAEGSPDEIRRDPAVLDAYLGGHA